MKEREQTGKEKSGFDMYKLHKLAEKMTSAATWGAWNKAGEAIRRYVLKCGEGK